ncbi:MAG: protein-L-isoaspartate O-methyltransferase [bacterium]|nr:protein-L-isoaspartate O-methyltransferase [bacterium]
MDLIDSLIEDGWLKTPRIVRAFKKIKRADFMSDEMKHLAEINEALPIGYGQTIYQPLTVAFMFEQLEPRPGDNILDIGSGSGWTTALLAEIVGEKGRVTAIELIPELKEFGEKNAAKYNFIKKKVARFICADGSDGYKKEAPFDKILVSAAAKEVPKAWKDQLKIKGRIVCPINSSILTIIRKSERDLEQIEHSGFVFVPLVKT